MANIILHQFQGIAVGLDKKDGYVNATKLCVAYNIVNGTTKQPSDWTRSERAKRYIAYVSSIRSIPREQLVIAKSGNTDESGTWVHPDLAIPFATWLSVEFEYQVQSWIQEWRDNRNLQKFPDQLTGTVPVTPEIAGIEFLSAAIDITMPYLSPDVRTNFKISAIATKFPQYREALEAVKPKVLLEAPLLSPTQLGELMNPPRSARAVNKLLCSHNLQKPSGQKNPAYELIGSGNEFGKVLADTARGHGKTIQHIRWYESVLKLIEL
jgi:hypothetical protein